MIHYHGGRHSTQSIAVAIWKGRHALISHADPQQLPIAAEVSQSFVLDNGAFSVWTQGETPDWPAYYAWVDEWRRHPGFDWALIPDVIDGNEDQNDALVADWPFRFSGVPVWHMHESIERFHRLCGSWPRVAIGSSGDWATPGTSRWWQRMAEALDAICPGGQPLCKLHGLRMLSPRILPFIPFASADSACVSRSIGTSNWGGCFREASGEVKAAVLTSRIEAYQSANVWAGLEGQGDLFGEVPELLRERHSLPATVCNGLQHGATV